MVNQLGPCLFYKDWRRLHYGFFWDSVQTFWQRVHGPACKTVALNFSNKKAQQLQQQHTAFSKVAVATRADIYNRQVKRENEREENRKTDEKPNTTKVIDQINT